jgi:hypothetical protein
MSDEFFPYRARTLSRAESAAGRHSRPAGTRRGALPRAIPLSALTGRKNVMVRRALGRMRDDR